MTGSPRKKGFTLAEMIMAIGLLALFSVFIVQIFVKSDQLTRKARVLDQSVACASNLADLWKMDEQSGIPDQILDLRLNRTSGKAATVSLDQNFQICQPGQAFYQAVLTIEPVTAGTDGQAAGAPGLWQLTVALGRAAPSDDGPLYTLQATRYFPEEAAVR
jgi:prepilin-type N-terminal cleavage/methylation domain-containing protein